MSSVGVCLLCQTKCVVVWTTDPCKHGACRNCLTSCNNFTTCFACRKQVRSFRCPGFQYGCQFNSSQGTWKQHEVKCMFLPVECPYRCSAILSKKMLSRHIDIECPLRPAACRHCKDSVFQVELNQHERSCPQAPITCSFCRKEDIKRCGLSDHAKTCEKTPKPCPLKKHGCGFVGLDTVMNEHLNLGNHAPCIQELMNDLEERDQEIAHLRAHVETLENEITEFLAGGFVPFDKELKWRVMISDVSNAGHACTLTSPIYKHRSTKVSFCFTLKFRRDNRELLVTLVQCILEEGDSPQSENFMVKVEKCLLLQSDRKTSEIGRENRIVCRNQDLLRWTHSRDAFYTVTFAQDD